MHNNIFESSSPSSSGSVSSISSSSYVSLSASINFLANITSTASSFYMSYSSAILTRLDFSIHSLPFPLVQMFGDPGLVLGHLAYAERTVVFAAIEANFRGSFRSYMSLVVWSSVRSVYIAWVSAEPIFSCEQFILHFCLSSGIIVP